MTAAPGSPTDFEVSGDTMRTAEDFWANTQQVGDCLEWQGFRYRGYGVTRWSFGDKSEIRAHRVAFLLNGGEIPPGMIVRHSCDNPACVDPEHLLVGTQSDNMRDCSERGRLGHQKSSRTHCKQGHLYGESNTGYYKGKKFCRECRKKYFAKGNQRSAERRRLRAETLGGRTLEYRERALKGLGR